MLKLSLLGALAQRALTVPLGPPEQFHVTVTNAPGEIIVTYVTKEDAPSSCTVDGVGIFQGKARSYTAGGWQGVIHAVTFTKLKPATTYAYSCAGARRELRTPAVSWPLRVAAVADLGEACSKPGCGNATIQALNAGAAKGEYDVLIHAGDIAYTSGDQDIWDEFLREMDPGVSRVPYMVCPGNHEHYYNFTAYRTRFDMPGPHREDPDRRNLWGSYDIGGVHFISFSTEHLKSPFVDEQLDFLRADLTKANANRDTVPWIIAYAHKPLYCSTEDYYDCSINMGMGHIRRLFEPLFQEFGVDVYLTGHVHNYERTFPVFNGTAKQRSYDNPKATVHVVIGSAGDDEGLTDRWQKTTPAWSVAREGEHVGYAEMVFANASTLTFNYRNAANGSLIDYFSITKTRAEKKSHSEAPKAECLAENYSCARCMNPCCCPGLVCDRTGPPKCLANSSSVALVV